MHNGSVNFQDIEELACVGDEAYEDGHEPEHASARHHCLCYLPVHCCCSPCCGGFPFGRLHGSWVWYA